MVWCWIMSKWCSYNSFMYNWCWMMSWSSFVNYCIETIMIISCVINSSYWTIGFYEWILSFYNITITCFMLWFNITSMCILNSIVEWVFWICNGFMDYSFSNWSMYKSRSMNYWTMNIWTIMTIINWCCLCYSK